MIEGMSSSPSDSASARQMQMSMVALRQSVEQERRLAGLLAQQVTAPEPAAATNANPPHMGSNVDTYA